MTHDVLRLGVPVVTNSVRSEQIPPPCAWFSENDYRPLEPVPRKHLPVN